MSQVQRASLLALTLIGVVLLTVPAHGFRLASAVDQVLRTPAEALKALPVERSVYDAATRCTTTRRPGVERMLRWLDANAAGSSWGSYRCELWGKGTASLHAEGRAIDWHLDSRVPSQRAAGKRLIRQLLATDSAGNRQALARRMGVQELIWDCSYWGAGMDEFRIYRPCYAQDGRTRRKHVGATLAHLDHIHVGLTKAGAMARTSFWTRRAPAAAQTDRPAERHDVIDDDPWQPLEDEEE